MAQPDNPRRLDLKRLAHAATALSAQQALGDFARLTADAPSLSPLAPVEWRAQAEWRSAPTQESSGRGAGQTLWLHLQAQTELPQTCQRCLAAVSVPLQVDRWFRFVADEATAEAQDDDSDEDLLVLESGFDLLALIEDELILALPLVPMHDECPAAPALRTEPLAEDAGPENPFAALAAWKARTR